MSKTALNRASRCCCVRFLNTILAQILLIPNSSVNIKRTVYRFMFISSAIILTVNLRLDRTSSLTRAALSPVRVDEGHPLRCPSSKWALLSENILCQRKACALDIASSPKACSSFLCVVVTMSLSLTQKNGIPLLSFPWQGSQTRPDIALKCSTMRHCTATPLQMGMDEEPRSKVVSVSGLQYCQYS